MRRPDTLKRLARMDARELRWRAGAAARNACDRARLACAHPAWDRADLAEAIDPDFGAIRGALTRHAWMDAHRTLARHCATSMQRFPIAPASRPVLVAAIGSRWPDAAAQAVARGDRIVSGRYDLLGYRDLRFDRAEAAIDWHCDPVHQRTAPARFWSSMPFLDPDCGDHKIIWELNRHQHWLALGRAFWLSGERKYRDRFLEELASWIAANPPLVGINWASMLELGFRSISWVWALQFFVDPGAADESPWLVDLLLGLDRQLTQIARNLSYYFSPNTHLLGEALALYVAGRSLPLLARSAAHQRLGRRILLDESRRQIAADGGHCERSTHYHRYTLDFYLLALIVARITGDPVSGEFADAVSRLAAAARLLATDAGRLPQFGDDDGGALFPMTGRAPSDLGDSLAVAAALLGRPDLATGPAPEEAQWLLGCPALGGAPDGAPPAARSIASGALAETGYYVSRSARGDHLVVDGGAHGFRNGGHAHADSLSLTLTIAGVPLLIDPGTGTYTADPHLRDHLRSSQLHNTLAIDRRSQSTPAGPFAWARTADGHVRRWQTGARVDYFEGTHDGYRPIEHRRHLFVLHGDLVVALDLASGPGSHRVSVAWHVEPRWRVTTTGSTVGFAAGDHRCQLVVPAGRIERFTADPQNGLGWQAPIYGRLVPSTSLRITRDGELPIWIASVFSLDAANPIVDARFVEVAPVRGAFAHAAALRIARRATTDRFLVAEPAEAGRPAAWRADGFETDAEVLCCRSTGPDVECLTLLDGSFVRA
jgi:hypothetical protein